MLIITIIILNITEACSELYDHKTCVFDSTRLYKTADHRCDCRCRRRGRTGRRPPDRMLNEARKRLRKAGVELPGIDSLGPDIYNVGAAAGLGAGRPVRR